MIKSAAPAPEAPQRIEVRDADPRDPHVMLGLIVYGIAQGMTSLRQLEQLVQRQKDNRVRASHLRAALLRALRRRKPALRLLPARMRPICATC